MTELATTIAFNIFDILNCIWTALEAVTIYEAFSAIVIHGLLRIRTLSIDISLSLVSPILPILLHFLMVNIIKLVEH